MIYVNKSIPVPHVPLRDFYEKSLLDPQDRQGGGMSIGAILSIIHSDYRKQITSRKYFSIGTPLIRQETGKKWELSQG